jgi:hypothetical protein
MKPTSLILIVAWCAAMGVAAARAQAPDDERRAAVTVMRAINTAENAVKQSTGKYLELGALLEHRAMGGVKANFSANGQFFFHRGAQVRLVLAADGSGYQVMVVPVSTCGTAVFSNEGGLIYTGKVLDC